MLIATISVMSVDDVNQVSPASASLKRFIKVPLVLGVTGAAMLVSLSDLQFKLIGGVLEDAVETADYMALIPLGFGVAYTATNTLNYLNEAMKNYEQLEVIPIYNTMTMCWGMAVGMICMNEVRLYPNHRLALLSLAMCVCVMGMSVLLQKTKSKKE